MSLARGSKLGAYEVTAPIGAGGMGEVFRAKDTRLGRDVAIKVLPAAFAQDPERLARFEREARVLLPISQLAREPEREVNRNGRTRKRMPIGRRRPGCRTTFK